MTTKVEQRTRKCQAEFEMLRSSIPHRGWLFTRNSAYQFTFTKCTAWSAKRVLVNKRTHTIITQAQSAVGNNTAQMRNSSTTHRNSILEHFNQQERRPLNPGASWAQPPLSSHYSVLVFTPHQFFAHCSLQLGVVVVWLLLITGDQGLTTTEKFSEPKIPSGDLTPPPPVGIILGWENWLCWVTKWWKFWFSTTWRRPSLGTGLLNPLTGLCVESHDLFRSHACLASSWGEASYLSGKTLNFIRIPRACCGLEICRLQVKMPASDLCEHHKVSCFVPISLRLQTGTICWRVLMCECRISLKNLIFHRMKQELPANCALHPTLLLHNWHSYGSICRSHDLASQQMHTSEPLIQRQAKWTKTKNGMNF